MKSEMDIMKFILLSLFLITSCNTKVDIQNSFELSDGIYSYCDFSIPQSTKVTYNFSNPYVTKMVETIDGSNCDEHIPIFRDQQEFTYTFDSQTYVLRETKVRAKLTFYDQDEIDLKNAEGFCGITDWKKGETRNITNTECRGQTFSYNDVKDYQVQLTRDSLIIDGVTFYKFR